MKLRNKIFIVTSMTCLLFIAATLPDLVRNSLLSYIPAVILFGLIIVGFTRFFITKRVEKINEHLKKKY